MNVVHSMSIIESAPSIEATIGGWGHGCDIDTDESTSPRVEVKLSFGICGGTITIEETRGRGRNRRTETVSLLCGDYDEIHACIEALVTARAVIERLGTEVDPRKKSRSVRASASRPGER